MTWNLWRKNSHLVPVLSEQVLQKQASRTETQTPQVQWNHFKMTDYSQAGRGWGGLREVQTRYELQTGNKPETRIHRTDENPKRTQRKTVKGSETRG